MAKNRMLLLKCFNSTQSPKTFLDALTSDFLNADLTVGNIGDKKSHILALRRERPIPRSLEIVCECRKREDKDKINTRFLKCVRNHEVVLERKSGRDIVHERVMTAPILTVRGSSGTRPRVLAPRSRGRTNISARRLCRSRLSSMLPLRGRGCLMRACRPCRSCRSK